MTLDQMETAATNVAAAIDEIDKHECAPDSIATAICHLLKKSGVPEVDSYIAGALAVDTLKDDFMKLYWKSGLSASKLIALFAATKTANKMIELGAITDEQRKETAEILAKSRQTEL